MKNNQVLKAPLTINWAVTNRCNFKCRHCYSRSDPSEELDIETLKDAFGKVAEAGVFSINFGGGEPLLRADLLELSRHACDLNMKVSMNTNGFLVDAGKAKELKTTGFSKVGVSIDSHLPDIHDGFRGIRGSHERAVAALRYLREAGIATSISSVICRINYNDIGGLVSFAMENGAGQLNFHNFKCTGLGYANKDEIDLSPEEWKEFYTSALEAKKKVKGLDISLDDPIIALLGVNGGSLVKGSICGKLSLNIKSNGDITPCGFIPVVIGSIVRDDLREVWKNSEVLERMRNKKPTGKCAGCGKYEDCIGGCTARALALTGDMMSPDPHCWRSG